jgi:hypothetical protein
MAKTQRAFGNETRVDLFAGFPVSDYSRSLAWYEQLFGCQPAFLANDTEAVWELEVHAYGQRPGHPSP